MARRPFNRRMPWAAYLWPGLPHLWNEGSWAGLALALGFTILLNTLILATLVWPEWLAERVKLGCGLATAAVWLAALVETRNELRRQAARRSPAETAPGDPPAEEPAPETSGPDEGPPDEGHDNGTGRQTTNQLDELFCEAQRSYLAADWIATERTLTKLLRLDRDDIEGLLLLASLRRVTGRRRKAERLLSRLARRQDAEAWRFEIDDELERLANPEQANPEHAGTEHTATEHEEPETHRIGEYQPPGIDAATDRAA